MKTILFKQKNQNLGIMFALENIDTIKQNLRNGNIDHQEIEIKNLNIENDYFEAYEYCDQNGYKINFTKAKEIQKNKWRYLRVEILNKLDVEFMRALEAGDAARQDLIKSQKQALRDVTSIELPDSLEEIKNTIPDILDINKYQPIYSTPLDENGIEIQ